MSRFILRHAHFLLILVATVVFFNLVVGFSFPETWDGGTPIRYYNTMFLLAQSACFYLMSLALIIGHKLTVGSPAAPGARR